MTNRGTCEALTVHTCARRYNCSYNYNADGSLPYCESGWAREPTVTAVAAHKFGGLSVGYCRSLTSHKSCANVCVNTVFSLMVRQGRICYLNNTTACAPGLTCLFGFVWPFGKAMIWSWVQTPWCLNCHRESASLGNAPRY